MTFRRWDPIDDAIRLLNLHNNNHSNNRRGRPSKQDIEKAFRIAAIRYHPDTTSNNSNSNTNDDDDDNNNSDPHCNSDSNPNSINPVQFRHCLEARDLLLNHFHHVNRGQQQRIISTDNNYPTRRPPNYPPYYSPYSHSNTKKKDNIIFVKGFPFRTLHMLTTRSKIYIKGATAILIVTMGLYDGYIRYQNQKQKQNKS